MSMLWKHSMLKFSSYFGLKMSHLILSATEQLSITLQGKDTTIQDAIQASKLPVDFLERQRCDSAYESFILTFWPNVKISQMSLLFLVQDVRPPRRIDDGALAHVFDSPNHISRSNILKYWIYHISSKNSA